MTDDEVRSNSIQLIRHWDFVIPSSSFVILLLALKSRRLHHLGQAWTVNELELLKPVSRSFYISIRLLPKALREPVALGYLLARTSDTIADASAVDVEKRIKLLDRFARAIAGKEQAIGNDLAQLRGSAGMTLGEKALLGFADEVLQSL